MVSILDLSPELLTLCFDQIEGNGRGLTIQHLNLVCRRFRSIASSLLFRSIDLAFAGHGSLEDIDSAALLSFVESNRDFCTYVRDITVVCKTSWEEHQSRSHVHESFQQILPHLSGLQSVRIIPKTDDRNRATGRSFDPSLLIAFKSLNVRITLDKHLDNMNPCIIEDTNQIEGLSTALLYTSSIPQWTQNDTPSEIFAKNLKKNNKLRHLEVSIGLHNPIRQPDDVSAIKEQTQTLIDIGRAVPGLNHLSLKGALSFGNEGWTEWSRIWPKLESLSLTGDGIIQEFVKHLGTELPSLKSLVVDRRVLGPALNGVIREMINPVEIEDDIGSFLLPLRLHRLSIVGCSTNVLENLNSSGATLRSLCFHQDVMPPLGTANAQKWLRAEDLQNGISKFKDLGWLALDVQPFHLSDQIDAAEGVRIPTMGQTPEDLHIARSLAQQVPPEITETPCELQTRSLMAGREQQQYLQRLQLARTEALSRVAARSQQTTLAPVQMPPNNRPTGGICHIPSAPPRLPNPLHDDHVRMLNLRQTEMNIGRTQRVQQLHQLRQEESEPEHIRTYLESILSSAGAYRIADVFENCCSSIEEAQSVFQALASMPKLLHLRLFIHKSILLSSGREARPWVLSITDAIYTFSTSAREKIKVANCKVLLSSVVTRTRNQHRTYVGTFANWARIKFACRMSRHAKSGMSVTTRT